MKWNFFYPSISALLLALNTSSFANTPNNKLLPILTSPGNWFITLSAGEQYPQWNNPIKIDNGSDLPTPYNKDLYSTKSNSEAVIALGLGRRWKQDDFWFPSYSVGVFWQYFFRANLGHTITQNSIPEFTNYTYDWMLTSNLLLASAKLNLFQYGKISPYINGGIGSSFNRTSDYKEMPLPNVTARVSPNFGNFSTSEFSYNIGAGIDVQVMPHFIASVGYIYQDLGQVSSGPGKGTWSNQSLNPGSYHSSEWLVSLTYLFGENKNVSK